MIAFTGWVLVRVFQHARAQRDEVTRVVAATLFVALLSPAISMGCLAGRA